MDTGCGTVALTMNGNGQLYSTDRMQSKTSNYWYCSII
uniref:Uncharacterized protein n=1 Tax=Anguilla anguilla TaxID=7936 RepID=A0A0E9R3C7_ANGAN